MDGVVHDFAVATHIVRGPHDLDIRHISTPQRAE